MHCSQTIKSLRVSPPSEVQAFLVNFGRCPGRKTPEIRKCQRADSLSHLQRRTQAVLSHLASCQQAPQASSADLTPHHPLRRASVNVSISSTQRTCGPALALKSSITDLPPEPGTHCPAPDPGFFLHLGHMDNKPALPVCHMK